MRCLLTFCSEDWYEGEAQALVYQHRINPDEAQIASAKAKANMYFQEKVWSYMSYLLIQDGVVIDTFSGQHPLKKKKVFNSAAKEKAAGQKPQSLGQMAGLFPPAPVAINIGSDASVEF